MQTAYSFAPLSNGCRRLYHQCIRRKRAALTLFALILTLSLGACTNSKLIIGPLYNRLDDQIRGEFHKLGKFNPAQVAAFEQRLGSFHVWHRQVELPKYAQLLRTVRLGVIEPDAASKQEVADWINTSERYSGTVRQCHPANYAFPIMQTLTDEQINFIERRFANERRKNFNRYQSKTADERRQDRVENVVKWASRIGFNFTNTQRTLLNDTFKQQISLRNQYYKLVHVWNKELFVLARNQESASYEKDMGGQVNKLWTLLENGHPEQWNANRKLWRGFAYDFIQTLNHDQRTWADTWLKKMANTLDGIAKDKPSFNFPNDPNLGCTVPEA